MMPPVNQRIYLTGFMGCGKSTTGPVLASILGFSFLDLDEVIESAEGRSISEIINRDGERRFREIEQDMLHAHTDEIDTVIATGGGTLASKSMMELAKKWGYVVYLRASVDLLFSRLENSTERPLIEVIDKADTISDMLKARAPVYEMAHTIVDVDRRSPEELAAKIAEAISTI